jgi:hypothetical protein
MSQKQFAAFIPVGPTVTDASRAVYLIRSLLKWEPDLGWCIFVEDTPAPIGFSTLNGIPARCQVVELLNPRRGQGGDWRGAVSAAKLIALGWVHNNTDADFVLKIDTDALVIRPFSTAVRHFLLSHPTAGLVGTVGYTCNREIKQLFDEEPQLAKVCRLLPRAAPSVDVDAENGFIFISNCGVFSHERRKFFDKVRPHIEAAIHRGFRSTEYCQGGASVVTRDMIDAMAVSGYLESPETWINLPFGDEPVMAMYARALGMDICDCSNEGEPFGIQYIGLPYPLETIRARRHSLIHSVKNDRRYTEAQIRSYFLD